MWYCDPQPAIGSRLGRDSSRRREIEIECFSSWKWWEWGNSASCVRIKADWNDRDSYWGGRLYLWLKNERIIVEGKLWTKDKRKIGYIKKNFADLEHRLA